MLAEVCPGQAKGGNGGCQCRKGKGPKGVKPSLRSNVAAEPTQVDQEEQLQARMAECMAIARGGDEGRAGETPGGALVVASLRGPWAGPRG